MKNQLMDVITVGRSSIDLYSQNVGSAFEDIKGFDAYVGGSPLNIAVGCSRLGLNAALFTAVGADKVGDFVLNFLEKENVETTFIPKLPSARTSAVVLGIEPPDKFPLVFYRDNAADSQITIDHADKVNVAESRLIEISGTALNIEPSRSTVFHLVEKAKKSGTPVLLDLDFRADQWHDLRTFGLTTRAILPNIDIAIGTEEEILATMLESNDQVKIKDQQISAPEITGDIQSSITFILSLGVQTLIVKRGAEGVTIYTSDGHIEDVPGFPVEILNVLGAGDAFASGFIYGHLQGWDLTKSCRMGNASGAQVVLQPGCANFMPYLKESLEFINSRGGF